jgi:hypothetical protein
MWPFGARIFGVLARLRRRSRFENPVTEPKRRQNPKRPLPVLSPEWLQYFFNRSRNRHGTGCGANPGVLFHAAKRLARPLNQGESSLLVPDKAKKIHGRVLTLFDVYRIGFANTTSSSVKSMMLRVLTRFNANLHSASSLKSNPSPNLTIEIQN